MASVISPAQLAANNGQNGAPMWVCIGSEVFDLTRFQTMHPGGLSVLQKVGGKDATEAFRLFHAPHVMEKYRAKLKVGEVVDNKDKQEQALVKRDFARSALLDAKSFGDQIPFGDPAWYQRATVSPFHKQTHLDFRARVRDFVDQEIIASMHEWRHLPEPPKDLLLKMGKEGFLACMAGGPPFPRDHVDPGTPEPENFDFFHIQILFDEISRCGDAGVIAALTNGPSIAVCALLKFGSEEVNKSGIVREVLMGRKMIGLAVTEPIGGSDVSSLSCDLIVAADGTMTLTGNKKFITNGTYADYFTLVARDAGKGLTMCVVEANTEQGFSTKKVKIQGNSISGTAFLDFNKTPVKFLVGRRGDGFKMQMAAFNFERWYVSVCMIRLARVCLEECMKYSIKRKTFGKELHQHQAVRMRMAEMIRDVESCQAWLDMLTFQMNALDIKRAAVVLGDVLASAKVQSSYVYDRCARHATHIFGGNSLQVDGPGGKIEPALGQTKAYLIPAGAADILDDFTVRQSIRMAKAIAKL